MKLLHCAIHESRLPTSGTRLGQDIHTVCHAAEDGCMLYAVGCIWIDASSCFPRAEVVQGIAPSDLRAALAGRHVKGSHRHGKQMWLDLGDDCPALLLHYGMTGSLLVKASSEGDERGLVGRGWRIEGR